MNRIPVVNILFLLFFSLLLIACSGGDDGDVIGTGGKPDPVVQGTAALGSPIEDTEVRLKDNRGRVRTARTNSDGKFSINVKDLEAPFFLNIDTLGKRYFSVAHKSGVANLHPFTDVITRNWFRSRGRFIESEFDNASGIVSPPTEVEISALITAIKNLLVVAFSTFGVDANFNLITSAFDANRTRFDRLLDHVTVKIKENKITIKLRDPETGFTAYIIFEFDIEEDLAQQDLIAPSQPSGVAVIPASTTTIAVLWNSSIDNIGVQGYNVYRASDSLGNDTQLVTTSPFPSFIDTQLMADTTYCYAIEAIDGAGNTSTRTDFVCADTLADPSTAAPNPPTGLNITVLGSNSLGLRWTPPNNDTDILGYDVYRTPTGGVESKIATTVATNYDDTGLLPETEYCYRLVVFDGDLLRTGGADPALACETTPALSGTDADDPVTSATPVGGTYTAALDVALSCVDASTCTIYYTTDGSEPTSLSPMYNGTPIPISANTTLKYRGIDAAGNIEDWNYEIYVIDFPPPNTPTVSGVSSTTNVMPTWTWSPNGGGNGTYRYKLDDSDLTTGTVVTTATSYTPITALSIDAHTLYVQERNNEGDWSVSGSFTTTITTAPPPPISIDVTTAMEPVVESGDVLYVVTVSNTSPGTISNVNVRYTVPVGVSFNWSQNADPNVTTGCTACAAGGVANWALGQLMDAESRTIFINASIDASLANGDVINSAFQVTANGLSSPIDIVKTVEVYNSPSAEIALSASSGSVIPNDKFTYTVDVGNIAGSNLTGVELRLSLPGGVTFDPATDISDNGSVDLDTDEIVWFIETTPVNTLPANTAIRREVNVSTVGSAYAGQILTARAELRHDNGVAMDRAAEHAITVASTRLPLTVDVSTVANPVVAGDRVLYAITVTNNSFQTVRAVEVLYRVPKGLTFNWRLDTEPDAAGVAGGCTSCSEGGEEFWDLGDLLEGDSRTIVLNARVDTPLVDHKLISAPIRVQANYLDLAQTISLRKTVAEYSNISTQLSLGASTDAVTSGQTFTFNLDVGNTSGTDLTGVVLHASLPDGVSATPITDGGSEISEGEVVWTIGDLLHGENLHREVTVLVTGVAKDILVARAKLIHDGGLEVDARAEHAVNVVASTLPLKMKVVTAQNPVVAGNRLAYTITVNNDSFQTVRDVNVMYRVPKGVTFNWSADAEPDATSGCNSCLEGGEESWNLGNLLAGESRTINLNAIAAADLVDGSLISAPIRVTAFNEDVVDDIHLTKTAAIYRSPSAQLAMSANADKVTPGSSFTYNIDLGNIANGGLTGVELRTKLPAGVNVESTSDPYSVDTNGDIIWAISNVDVYANLHREIKVNVASGMEGEVLTARSSVIYSGGLVETDLVAEHSVTVATVNLPLDVVIDVAQSPAVPGGRLMYTITVNNTSFQSLSDVSVMYRVPKGISFNWRDDAEPDASSGCNGCLEGAEEFWSFSTLNPGESRTISLNAIVDANDLPNGMLISAPVTVTATYTANNITSSYNIYKVKTVPVYDIPSVQLVMGAMVAGVPVDPVTPNSSFTYTIDAGNTTGSNQAGVQLRTRLPAGVTFNSASNGGAEDLGTGEIVWNVGDLAAGALLHREVNVTANADVAGTILSAQTRLSYLNGLEADQIAEHSVTATATALPLSLNLSSAPNPVIAGDPLTYTIIVTNTSTNTVNAVSVNYRVPEGLSFNWSIDAEPNVSSGCTACVAGNEAVWSLGDMLGGASQAITITASTSSTLPLGHLISTPIRVTATGMADVIHVVDVAPVE